MWFYPFFLLLVILAIAGGTLLGGVYTIVLVPIGAIVLVSAVVYALWGRALQGSRGGETDASTVSDRPLPTQPAPDSGRERTSPEALVQARRDAQ